MRAHSARSRLEGRLAAGLLLASIGCAPASEVREADATLALELPAGPGSLAPNLDLGGDGVARLTWIEPLGDGEHALRFSAWDGERWGAAVEVARGSGWFVNWADVPALAALPDGTLAAAWLEQIGSHAHAYGIQVALSGDGGATWKPKRALHDDASASEHGFVSLEAFDADTFGAVWLDGRAVEPGDGAPRGAMQLRGRALRRDGSSGLEQVLDERVCDCCPTALVRVAGHTLAAYRDRGEDELRDISLISLSAGRPAVRSLSADGWRIDGCPVNGPALDVRGESIGAAWYTEGGEGARVCCALSTDGGATFGAPLRLSQRPPIGAVDAAFGPDGALWVSWLDVLEDGSGAWQLTRVGSAGEVSAPRALAAVTPSRKAGIARLVALEDGLLFAWTEVGDDGSTRVRSLLVPLGT
jgi:hypothetical protein